jgi:hypothetical protein
MALDPWCVRVGADSHGTPPRATAECRPAEDRRLGEARQRRRFVRERISVVPGDRRTGIPATFHPRRNETTGCAIPRASTEKRLVFSHAPTHGDEGPGGILPPRTTPALAVALGQRRVLPARCGRRRGGPARRARWRPWPHTARSRASLRRRLPRASRRPGAPRRAPGARRRGAAARQSRRRPLPSEAGGERPTSISWVQSLLSKDFKI